MNSSSSPRFTVRMNPSLHEWFKTYASRMNTSMSELVIEYIGKLRHPKAVLSDAPYEHKHRTYEQEIERADLERKHYIELAEEKTGEIHHLRAELTEKNRQIETLLQQLSHSQQLLAIQSKTTAALTEQNQLLLEDQRHRERNMSWFKRTFRWT